MRPTQVRPIEPADVPELVELCIAARRESTVGNQVCAADPEVIGRQLRTLAGAPDSLVLVARGEDGAVGLLLGRVVGPSPFTDHTSLAVEAVYVAADQRRRGVGHALMAGAADLADQAGARDVYATPIPGARGMQRFFVQLGFSPAAAHRTTTLAALRRRLSPGTSGGGRRFGRRGLDDLIAHRRQSRIPTGELPVLDPAVQDPSAAKRRQVSLAVHSRRAAESSTTIS
ncbi:GNAT family N-acetyltransferase [Isoptericola sp. b441]|uniref:GNAT family N-acetyltransferase n=1 Tax=Actinotalea lenta TaxID=3064654 RepID=A0ABT9DDX2_9CELL|nr:GNAT family N-acetyltransferase [Isoptericola sp. b441]MDO8107651.1 GNAT family N-acetyltransferase [Isoptericola sp. b441]